VDVVLRKNKVQRRYFGFDLGKEYCKVRQVYSTKGTENLNKLLNSASVIQRLHINSRNHTPRCKNGQWFIKN
jgi:hypothetical protein